MADGISSRKKSRRAGPDRIRISVIGNRLDAISKEIGQTMLRTSRSPIFSEARDFVTAIFDSKSRLVAQTAYIPVLMGALPYALRSIATTFAGDVHDGDIFILNDPYRGNNHPPDITIAKPVFHRRQARLLVRIQGAPCRRGRRRSGRLQSGGTGRLGGRYPHTAR